MTRPSPDRLLARADREVANGRAWRAKEMLRGAVRTYPTDPRVLTAYAVVLDSLGDRVEAGKYYFLSGERGGRAAGPIGTFLERHGRGRVEDLIAQFPRAIRTCALRDLPDVVVADLEARGLPPGSGGRSAAAGTIDGRAQTLRSRHGVVWRIGCALAGAAVTVSAIVGLVVIVGHLSRWLGR